MDYIEDQIRFIKISADKRPKHTFDITYSYDEIKDEPSYAILLPEQVVMIDFDDQDQWEAAKRVVAYNNYQCSMLQTRKGGHLIFRTTDRIKNSTNKGLYNTLKADIKGAGAKALEVVKLEGDDSRRWIKQIPLSQTDYLPKQFYPQKATGNNEMRSRLGQAEGGRNDSLYRMIIPLVKADFDEFDVKDVLMSVNQCLFDEPLPDNEVEAMLKGNNIFRDPKVKFFNEQNQFMHDVFAKFLQLKHYVYYHKNRLWIYENGVYVDDEHRIEALCIEYIPNIKANQRQEVIKYLKLLIYQTPPELPSNIINVKNGLLNLETGALEKHTPNYMTTVQIPTIFDPTAVDENVDKFFNSITDSQSVRLLLIQMIGYTLWKEPFMQNAFFLLGRGANGKSTFLDMMTAMIGGENISNVDISKLSERFEVAQLKDKMINVGGDISSSLIRDAHMFKLLASGDPVSVREIYGKPETLKNTAKLIFAGNNYPKATEKSDGFYRRVKIIPFPKQFKPGMPGFDRNLKDKLVTENAKSYLLNLALSGLQSILATNQWIHSDDVVKIESKFKSENDSIVAFIYDNQLKIEDVIGKTTNALYKEYVTKSAEDGLIPETQRIFNKKIKDYFVTEDNVKLHTKSTTREGVSVKLWTA